MRAWWTRKYATLSVASIVFAAVAAAGVFRLEGAAYYLMVTVPLLFGLIAGGIDDILRRIEERGHASQTASTHSGLR